MAPRARKAPDPRHGPVKELLGKLWAFECPHQPDQPWSGADARNLAEFLRASPALTVEQIAELLRNRARSDDHALGEPAFVWIRYATRYTAGPLDKYKQPKESPRGRQSKADAEFARLTNATGAVPAQHAPVLVLPQGLDHESRSLPSGHPRLGHSRPDRRPDGD